MLQEKEIKITVDDLPMTFQVKYLGMFIFTFKLTYINLLLLKRLTKIKQNIIDNLNNSFHQYIYQKIR